VSVNRNNCYYIEGLMVYLISVVTWTQYFNVNTFILGAHSSVVGWGTMLQDWRSLVRVPDEVDFFNLPNPSSHTIALGSTQPLTEMSTRNLLKGKGWPAHEADNLTAICEPNV
jgi:hypothetical protein